MICPLSKATLLRETLNQLDLTRVPTVSTKAACEVPCWHAPMRPSYLSGTVGPCARAALNVGSTRLPQACARFLKCVAGDAGPIADPESKGSIPYGAIIAWAWSEGLTFTTGRGWPEPDFGNLTISKIVDDAVDGITGVVRKLPAFQLHPDLQELNAVARAGADAFAHMTVSKTTLELNWELIQAGPTKPRQCIALASLMSSRKLPSRHAMSGNYMVATPCLQGNFSRLDLKRWQPFNGCVPFFLSEEIMPRS